ncbi:MAG: hypothetical protein FWE44_03165 [Defluviitaleaceae bacterium]|nr:hypothetical protein [Defluviitaleaceae bacterium]
MGDFEKMLEGCGSLHKDAEATVEAILALQERHGGEIPILYDFAANLDDIFVQASKVEKIVACLPSGDLRCIFTARYIYEMSWEEVAEAVNFSLQHAQRLHKQGIEWINNNEERAGTHAL